MRCYKVPSSLSLRDPQKCFFKEGRQYGDTLIILTYPDQGQTMKPAFIWVTYGFSHAMPASRPPSVSYVFHLEAKL